MSAGKKRRNRPKLKPPPPASWASKLIPTTARLLSTPLKRVVGILSLIVMASAVVPLFSPISVQTPTIAVQSNPFSLPIELSNDSPFPLFDVQAACGTGGVSLGHSGSMSNNKITSKTNYRSILVGRSKMTVRCDRAMVVEGLPIAQASNILYFSYRHFLWPFKWSTQFTFDAIVDRNGRVVRWVAR
jgi:hypothetical protein